MKNEEWLKTLNIKNIVCKEIFGGDYVRVLAIIEREGIPAWFLVYPMEVGKTPREMGVEWTWREEDIKDIPLWKSRSHRGITSPLICEDYALLIGLHPDTPDFMVIDKWMEEREIDIREFF